MRLKNLFLFFILITYSDHGHSQSAPVTWSFNAQRITNSEWIIHISTLLPPGWHIYSQHLAAGGPMPTTINLIANEEYLPVGKALEQGQPIQFYDSLYEMEITWYEQKVTFLQKVKVNCPVPFFQGTIDYMVCSEHVCIPQRKEFMVPL
jgi:hypothetical protein